jgi:cytochrome P450
MTAGPEFRMLRKIYHKMLSSQQLLTLRGLQEQESIIFIEKLLKEPDGFFEGAERFALSIVFIAVYGVRLATLKHPIIAELYNLWEHLRIENPSL